MIDTNFIDSYMKNNNQKPQSPEGSELWKSIKKGFGCSDAEAQFFATRHCNSLSFYTLCVSRGFIDMPYSTWCSLLLENGFMTKRGYIDHSKLDIADFFDFKDRFNSLKYYEDYKDCMNAVHLDVCMGYNIKVFSNSANGDHFMVGYVEDNKLILSDSGSRGIKVEARKVIPREKFQWILEV